MSIAVTDVRTRVRKITRRDNETEFPDTDLDVLILEACREISKRTLCLKTDTTGTLAGDGDSLTAPTDMVKSDSAIEEMYLSSNLMDRITFAEWQAGRTNGSPSYLYPYYYQGKISGIAYRDGTIYVMPSSGNDRNYELYYSKFHGALSTNLEFDDDLKMAVVWLTCKKVYDNYFSDSNIPSEKAEREYNREIALNAPAVVTVSRMRTTRE